MTGRSVRRESFSSPRDEATSDVQGVLDGDVDDFLSAALAARVGNKRE